MLPVRDETIISHSRIGTSTIAGLWLYLSIEFLIGGLISGFLSILDVLKSLLPKPPRDLIGDVVLVAGTSSKIGESLAEEFARNGCSIVCIDNELQSVETVASKLRSNCHSAIEEIGPRHRKEEGSVINRPRISAYECDLRDRNNICNVAKKVKDEIGRIDILVTCIGHPDQDIFDTASMTLMSHYWTVLAFLPSMLLRGKATIVGVIPAASSEDAYLGSRAAIGGLMDSLGQELSNQHHSQLTFLTVAPKADRRLMTQTEQQVAKEVVEAVKRDQCSLNVSWSSRLLYRISCSLYNAITKFTE